MLFAALLSSFALLASGPSHIALAQADPIASEDPIPSGAPSDDYGLMGWCYGALAGHVELYKQVLPEVNRIEAAFPNPDEPIDKVMADYEKQHATGQKILLTYARVISREEAARKTHGQKRTAVIAQGRAVWAGSDKADPRQLAQLWMSWALPGRCQSTAARLTPHAAG